MYRTASRPIDATRRIRSRLLLIVAIVSCPGFASLTAQAASDPPQIVVQPISQSLASGTNLILFVSAIGTTPLTYQWLANETNVLNATSNSLSLSRVALFTAGKYSVVVTNAYGAVTSDVARVTIDDDLVFRILALRTNGFISLEVAALTGDDRGGMAVSANDVFLTGDNATGRWRKDDLSGGTVTGSHFDALTSDLRTEKAYSLGNGSAPLTGPGQVTSLIEINDSGALTANQINLATTIILSGNDTGIFAGYGRVVLYDTGHVYDIAVPSGVVTDLGITQIFHSGSESFSLRGFWGVAEYFRGDIYLVYGRDSSSIARTRVGDGLTTTAASFGFFPQGISDLASFTFSPSLSRWFFHYEGTGIFGDFTRDENLGSAKALFTRDPGFPLITADPQGFTVYAGTPASLSVAASGDNLTYQWRLNGDEITDATNSTLVITNVAPADAGNYTIAVSSLAGTVISGSAVLSVISSPTIIFPPQGVTVDANTDVILQVSADGAPPLQYQWRFQGTNIADATNSFLQLTNVQPAHQGAYSVVVSNAYDFVLSPDAFLTVQTLPIIFSGPASATVNANDTITLQVSAGGPQPLFFEWYFNHTNLLDGETNYFLQLTNVQPSQQGLYTVKVSTLYGSIMSGEAAVTVIAAPLIVTQPQDQLALSGGGANFVVSAIGGLPLSYQWIFGGTNITGATNATLRLTNLTFGQAGPYSALVINRYGTNLSTPAVLKLINALPEGASFRITSLGTSNSKIVDHNAITSDDRGGMAASLSQVFYSGDGSTARFNLPDLSNGTALHQVYDSMICDLRTATAYLLANTNTPLTVAGGNATHLLELDGSTGLTNGNQIALSSPIPFSNSGGSVGFFSGYGRLLFYNTTNVYSVAVPSGAVSNLGTIPPPSHSFAENWAYWGLAEYYGGTNYIVYVRDSGTIVRTRVPDGLTTTVGSFVNLSDMASFTASLYNSRWYFHYEGNAQFGGQDETLGYADAVFEINPVHHYEWAPVGSPQVLNQGFAAQITARALDNSIVTNFGGSAALSGTAVSGGASIRISPTLPARFTNGLWAGQIVVTQSTDGMYLRALDTNGISGVSSPFAVYPSNDLFLTMTATPIVTIGQTITYTIGVSNIGPVIASGLILSNFLGVGVQLQSVDVSRGACGNDNGIVTCTLPDLSARDGVTISLQVVPFVPGSITNLATVRRLEVDPNPANNSALAVTTVNLPALSVQDTNTIEGNSGTNFVTINVNLEAPSTDTISVNFATLNGTAAGSSDFVPASGVLTFNPGVTNRTIQIGIRGDTIYETNEFFTISLNTPVNAILARSSAICTIINDDPAPIVSIRDASIVEGNSGTKNLNFAVTTSARTGLQILVAYATSDGTAVAGNDYLPVSGVVSFGANSLIQTQTVSVPILGDTVTESNEFFYVNITSISNALPGNIRGTGTIINDDGIGVLDHFVWNAIPSPQQTEIPIPVTITAKDFFNTTVSNFSGPVDLSGAVGQIDTTNVVLGDLQPVNTFSFSYTLGYALTPSRDITITHFRHLWGSKVSVWTDNGALLVSQNISGVTGSWTETELNSPLLLLGGVRYRIAAFTGGSTGTYFWGVNNNTFSDGTLDSSYYGQDDTFPNNSNGTERWYVDFRYSVGRFAPVSVTPTNSGSFTNGVWSGTVTLLSPSTNVILRAQDAAQHTGTSEPFELLDSHGADLLIGLSAGEPARFISNFVYSIQLSNAGPATATDVQITNPIPVQLEFISATVAGAACSYDNGVLVCSITELPAQSHTEITVVTRPLEGGSVTNEAGAVGAQADQFPANNNSTLIISICRDCDDDGMWDDWELSHGFNPFDPSDGAPDADHDGHNNLQEFLAGTDPKSANSITRMTTVTVLSNGLSIGFVGAPGKTFVLERNDTLSSSNWSPFYVFGNMGTVTNAVLDPDPRPPQRFYRLRVMPPP